MSYQSETIVSALQKLNKEYFLPTLQREFVWDSKRICKLFDSLMRGYPISSFLLWKVPPEAHEDLEIYKFLNSVSELGKHNERRRIDLVSELTFVLDGQQRLTSILVGLRGSYEARRKYGREGNKASVQKLYLDLLKDGDKAEDSGEPSYGFTFRESESNPDNRKVFWFEVGRILECPTDNQLGALVQATLDKVRAYRNVSAEHLDLVAANLRRLHTVVFREPAIQHYTETHADQRRMLEIFVRANSGGKPLGKPDLLLSNLTVHWKERNVRENAREEVKGFVDELNASLNTGCRNTKPALRQDFVLKSCLVLLNRPIAYDLPSFNRDTCQAILEEWEEIKKALAETVSVCNWFGLNGINLTSANALIPIAYFIYRSRGTVRLRSDAESDARNAVLVRRWLMLSLLNGVFGGASDDMLRQVRDVLKRHAGPGNDFPVGEIDAAVARAGRISTSDPRAIERILALKYKDPSCFLALTLLFDERGWGTISHDVDHIFPQEAFKSFLIKYKDQKDCLANLTLLLQDENRAKKSRAFKEWIETREPAFRRRHLIPAESSLWQMDKFPYFLEERNRLIQERLRVVLGGQ
jgi:hypothetical protein